MNGHAHRMAILLTLLAGCRRSSPPTPPALALTAPAVERRPAVVDLCNGRAGCSVSRQPVPGATGVALAVVRLAHAPDAGADSDRCDRREYWLSRPSGDLLVALDCETQWGADSRGPATITVRNKVLEISYVEMQSNDRCESYSARVEAAGPRLVEWQRRVAGVVVKDTCRPGKEQAPVDPAGDGLTNPLLTLHR